MNKQTGFKVLVLAAVLTTGVATVPTNASAAKWHKGTPKVIRGTYQGKRTSAAEGFGYVYKVTSKSFIQQYSNMSQEKSTKLKYKKLKGHTYRLVGHTQKRGMVLGGKFDSVVYQKGHKLALDSYKSYKKHGYKYLKRQLKKNPAKLTKKIKSNGRIVKD